MAISIIKRFRSYFQQIVFSKDRFRKGDKPKEEEYLEMMASTVWYTDDATINSAGIVSLATTAECIDEIDERASPISSKPTNDNLVVRPSDLQYFSVAKGMVIPYRPTEINNWVEGVSYDIEQLGTNVSSPFYTLLSGASFNWDNSGVITWIESNLLPANYKICNGRTISVLDHNLLTVNMVLPDMRGMFVRGVHGTVLSNNPTPNQLIEQRLGNTGGLDELVLEHSHGINISEITNKIIADGTPYALGISEIPAHTHDISDDSVTGSTVISASGVGVSSIGVLTTTATAETTTSAGGSLAHTHPDSTIIANPVTNPLGYAINTFPNLNGVSYLPSVDPINAVTDTIDSITPLPSTYISSEQYVSDISSPKSAGAQTIENRPHFISLLYITRIY
jgi:hypothetical protein